MIDRTLRMQFEAYLRQLSVALRREFAKHNCSYVKFEVDVRGRPDGDLRILYTLSDDTWGPNKTEAGDLNDLVEEFMRRRHWGQRHAPVLISQHNDETRSEE